MRPNGPRPGNPACLPRWRRRQGHARGGMAEALPSEARLDKIPRPWAGYFILPAACLLLTAYCLLLSAAVVFEARAEELRDPFTFGPREGAGVQAVNGPTLVGVLWDATKPLAILGDETVGVGDVVAEWRVVEIRQNGIVVQRGEHQAFVAPGSSLPSD